MFIFHPISHVFSVGNTILICSQCSQKCSCTSHFQCVRIHTHRLYTERETDRNSMRIFSSYHWRPVLSPNDSPPSLTVWVSPLSSLPFSLSLSTFPVFNFLRLRFRLLYLLDRKTEFLWPNKQLDTEQIYKFFILSDEKVVENLTFSNRIQFHLKFMVPQQTYDEFVCITY
jgi:hypothetical protein